MLILIKKTPRLGHVIHKRSQGTPRLSERCTSSAAGCRSVFEKCMTVYEAATCGSGAGAGIVWAAAIVVGSRVTSLGAATRSID
jgi:hypothetical protein